MRLMGHIGKRKLGSVKAGAAMPALTGQDQRSALDERGDNRLSGLNAQKQRGAVDRRPAMDCAEADRHVNANIERAIVDGDHLWRGGWPHHSVRADAVPEAAGIRIATGGC